MFYWFKEVLGIGGSLLYGKFYPAYAIWLKFNNFKSHFLIFIVYITLSSGTCLSQQKPIINLNSLKAKFVNPSFQFFNYFGLYDFKPEQSRTRGHHIHQHDKYIIHFSVVSDIFTVYKS